MGDQTLTRTREHGRPLGPEGGPSEFGPILFRLLCAEELSLPAARYPLWRSAEAAIGRASETGSDQQGALLSIWLGDPYTSSRHARLGKAGGRWTVTDVGSRNGTRLDGVGLPVGEPHELRDGQLLEIGHTFFFFRSAASGLPDGDARIDPAPGNPDPITLCPEWQVELVRAQRLARTPHEMLLQGESGAGKEVLARFIHEASGRAGPLVCMNCGAMPENLFEDELFGHVRGAFSGAHAERIGLVRSAEGGTLFLDEVADTPPNLQVKLLRVLEDHKVRPVGGEREYGVDVRVIAATNRELEVFVAQGKFRQDLQSRLGLPIRVPAVRERREDLGLLVRAILSASPTGLDRLRFDLDALRLVLRYSWPLNVRELRRALLSAADLAAIESAGEVVIAPRHLPQNVRDARRPRPTPAPAEEEAAPPRAPPPARQRQLSPAEAQQRDRMVELLRRLDGNVSAVAREMGKGRTQVQRWIARYGIDVHAVVHRQD